MLSIQGGAAIAKSLFPVLGPAGVTVMRVGLSAIILLAIFRPNLLSLTLRQWRAAAIYGATLGLMNLSFYYAILYIPLGLAVTLEFLGPLAVAVATSRRAADLIWAGLALLGIVLISPLGGNTPISPIGVALAAVAGALWGGYIIIGARMARHFSGTQGVSVGMICAAITVMLCAAPLGFSPSQITPHLLLFGLGVAILSSALPYSLEMIALRQLPRQLFSIMMSLEPAAAALLGWLILHESLSLTQWLAIVCVIGASVGATWQSRRTPDKHQEELLV
ncbi:DMT family transporter [Deinococcus psychrotolerans]|uniref:DMT family transporter n=2 Tax=Deinococcus psychrotolerans TaxID=2489213 RepID=A0A3G8YEK1_9DEIO|nr:DMT family transporter [Deinococcus psychrotolerans]